MDMFKEVYEYEDSDKNEFENNYELEEEVSEDTQKILEESCITDELELSEKREIEASVSKSEEFFVMSKILENIAEDYENGENGEGRGTLNLQKRLSDDYIFNELEEDEQINIATDEKSFDEYYTVVNAYQKSLEGVEIEEEQKKVKRKTI